MMQSKDENIEVTALNFPSHTQIIQSHRIRDKIPKSDQLRLRLWFQSPQLLHLNMITFLFLCHILLTLEAVESSVVSKANKATEENESSTLLPTQRAAFTSCSLFFKNGFFWEVFFKKN